MDDFAEPAGKGRRLPQFVQRQIGIDKGLLRRILRQMRITQHGISPGISHILKSGHDGRERIVIALLGGLSVVGVNEDGPRGQSKVKPFLRARKLTFPIALDLDSDHVLVGAPSFEDFTGTCCPGAGHVYPLRAVAGVLPVSRLTVVPSGVNRRLRLW